MIPQRSMFGKLRNSNARRTILNRGEQPDGTMRIKRDQPKDHSEEGRSLQVKQRTTNAPSHELDALYWPR
jgi:hypothetical protein